MYAFLEWWTTWVYGGPWFMAHANRIVISKHKSGIVCHLFALFSSFVNNQPRYAMADFATRDWKNKIWEYNV